MNLGLNFASPVVLGRGYRREASQLFARMAVQPTTVRKALINRTITGLINAGIWSQLDALWVAAAHDSQAGTLNWIAPQYNMTASGSPAPTFTTDRGFVGNGTTAYMATTLNPATLNASGTAKYKQNSASIGGWMANVLSTGTVLGVRNSATSFFDVNIGGVTLAAMRPNISPSGALNSVTISSVNDFLVASRTGASSIAAYENGTLKASDTTASTAPPSVNMPLMAKSDNGSIEFFISGTLMIGVVGSGLTAPQVVALYQIISTYLVTVGAV